MRRIGVIDIGTNTIRFVVAEQSEDGIAKFLFQDVITTRLGEGLARTGALSPEGIRRTIDGLRSLQKKASDFRTDLLEGYATEWARRANNTDEMLSSLAEINLPVWILTGEEEASMSLEAVKIMSPQLASAWVLDIGGGSCELIAVQNGTSGSIASLPVGAVNFTERFLDRDPPFPQLDYARAEAEKQFAVNGEKLPRVFLLGGTGAALGGLKIKTPPVDPIFFKKAQGLFLETEWIEETVKELARLPLQERKKLPGMESERADILVGGAVLLQGFLKNAKAAGATLCLYSFAHGILAKRFSARQG